jgi:hypothetical protein
MSLDAVERQMMPFVGETGGVGETSAGVVDRAPDRSGLPEDPGLSERLADARRQADEHRGHEGPRAPRPDRMRR